MPIVAILLASRNGERFLQEQLASYERQTFRDWELHASDDGSSDRTVALIQDFAQMKNRKVVIRNGPQQGYSQNFMSLVRDESVAADFFAFSDQDDIWNDDKLERALGWLSTIPADIPALYFTRTELIDEAGSYLGLSPLFQRAPDFRNALVQNIGGGNTMVFNSAARQLLIDFGCHDAVSHDWWLYQVVTGVGGVVRYDPAPSVKYRQHGKNVVGSGTGWRARMDRLRLMAAGRVSRWNAANLKALGSCRAILSPGSQRTLKHFTRARETMWPLRLFHLYQSGVYRQSSFDQIGLYLAALVKQI
jgi:glycosyltransferase involved in cell wall biosynthesis